jgi:hypothetical protein
MLRRWLGVGVANAAEEPPPEVPDRAWSLCEEGVALHVVRGPVQLRSAGGAAFSAPVYGGPVFHEPAGRGTRVEARYDGVTRGAVWLLADRPQMLEGTPAVVAGDVGEGQVVLAGPHLEHPDHPAAHLWLAGVLGQEPGEPPQGGAPPMAQSDPAGDDVVRRLASIRRRANALSGTSWLSGQKTWNGERLAGFTDALIPRARTLAHWGWGPRGREGELQSLMSAATERLGRRDPASWDAGWTALSEAASLLMDAYFANRRGGMAPPARAISRPPRLAPEGGWDAPTARLARGRGVRR